MNSLPHFNSHLSNCEARQLQLENQSTIDSIWNDIFYENPKEVSSIGGSQRTISSQSCSMSTLLDDSPSSSMLSGFSSNHSFTCSSMSHSSYIPRKLLFPPIRECESPLLDKTMMGSLTDCSFLQNGTLHSHSPGSTVKDLTLSDLMSTLDLSNKGCLPCRTPVDANTREDIPSNSILSSGPSSCNSGIQSNNHLQSNFSSLNYTQNPPGPNSLTQLQKLWLPIHNPPSILSQRTGDLNDFLEVPGSTPPSPLSSIFPGYSAEYCAIEKAAKMHRSAAALCDPTCTWSGSLPVRATKNPFYSCKLFLGGVPWDVTEQNLRQAFMQFGSIQVEWPGKENSANPPKGYVYILFENDKQVKALVASCWQEFKSGSYYYKVSSRRMKQKEVQVIPWIISDSNYVRCPSYQLDPAKTVFVGALHGMITAEGLANIMNDLFAGVIYSGIDTDKHRYPIGSGRITFNNLQSYRKAVKAAFIEIKTRKFTKKIQVDPYLADSPCQLCCSQQGPYFCRDEKCFKYFCRSCWLMIHTSEVRSSHKPLMRDPKLRTPKTVTRLY